MTRKATKLKNKVKLEKPECTTPRLPANREFFVKRL